MPNLTQYVNARGFELGLYTDSGTYTCSTGGRPFLIPGSYGYYAQDAATFASWGVRYVKMDWCNTDINGTQVSGPMLAVAAVGGSPARPASHAQQ